MEQRKRNWHVWLGFLLCLIGVVSYFVLFYRWPITRDVPWVNFLIFAAGLTFAVSGLWRAFGRPQEFKGKIAGSILGLLSLAMAGSFLFLIFFVTKQLPKSTGAPKVGDKAPEFSLVDTTKRPVTLASLFAAPIPGTQKPPKGVFLVFYRGYW